jgi:pyridoxal phosphate enzyme (YggS family)
MPVNSDAYHSIKNELDAKGVTLVAVSKTKPVEEILELYELGQRDFGENYVQELIDKYPVLPKDIRWHFIGHLQTNKVKQVASFVHLIHGVDSLKLLKEIDKQGERSSRVIDCLLQVHISKEETKFGLDEKECIELSSVRLGRARITGLMGMASFTDNKQIIRSEFDQLHQLFERLTRGNSDFHTLSCGMSADYQLAVESGSTMVRIGSLLFGERKP